MTATIELNSARTKLQNALGDNSKEYFQHMKLWFRKKTNKEDFDMEARKLLLPQHSHLHNEFLLAILNKCQTLASFTHSSSIGAVNSSAAAASSSASSNGVPTPPGSNTIKSSDDGSEAHGLKIGPALIKTKWNESSFNTSSSSDLIKDLMKNVDVDNMDLMEDQESALRYVFREQTLPDVSLIHGRVLVCAWEHGLEGGQDDSSVVNLIVRSVEQLLRNIIMAMLLDRSGYQLKDGRFPYAIGTPAPNPWLKNYQRSYFGRDSCLTDVTDTLTNMNGNDACVDPLVPVGPRLFKDVQLAALRTIAMSSAARRAEEDEDKQPVSLFDLLFTLQKHRRLIPSHSIYSLNIERLISRLHHKGHDD